MISWQIFSTFALHICIVWLPVSKDLEPSQPKIQKPKINSSNSW